MLFAQRTAFAADVKQCKNTKLVISFTFESKGLIRQIKNPELCQGEYIRLPEYLKTQRIMLIKEKQ